MKISMCDKCKKEISIGSDHVSFKGDGSLRIEIDTMGENGIGKPPRNFRYLHDLDFCSLKCAWGWIMNRKDDDNE